MYEQGDYLRVSHNCQRQREKLARQRERMLLQQGFKPDVKQTEEPLINEIDRVVHKLINSVNEGRSH